MKRADFHGMCRKRRDNYRFLLENVRENENLKIVFPSLDEASVPSHFTVYVREREKVQTLLRNLDVRTSVYWPQGPFIDLKGQENTQYIYDNVLSLRCDQRYTAADMEFTAAALNSCTERLP